MCKFIFLPLFLFISFCLVGCKPVYISYKDYENGSIDDHYEFSYGNEEKINKDQEVIKKNNRSNKNPKTFKKENKKIKNNLSKK